MLLGRSVRPPLLLEEGTIMTDVVNMRRESIDLKALLLSRTYLYTLFHKLFGGTPDAAVVACVLSETTRDVVEEYAGDDPSMKGLGRFLENLGECVDGAVLTEQARDEYTRLKAGYDKEFEKQTARLEELKQERADAAQGIDEAYMERYKAIRSQRFPVLASLRNDQCSGCNMSLPSAVAKQLQGSDEIVYKLELLMKKAGVSIHDRKVVSPALQKAALTGAPAAAMELPDGTIVTGRTSDLLGAASALLLNALKVLGGISDDIRLISPVIIEPIQHLKVDHLGNRNPRLPTDEVLIALSICAATNPTAELAMEQLYNLRGCEVHSSVILSPVDEKVFRRLGINITCEPMYENK